MQEIKQQDLNLASIFMPPNPLKENMAQDCECQRVRICFTFPKCHGIWAACTNKEPSGAEWGMQKTWIRHRRRQWVLSMWWLITEVGFHQQRQFTHLPLGGCTMGCMIGCDVAGVGRSSGWRFSFSVMLFRVPERPTNKEIAVTFNLRVITETEHSVIVFFSHL